MFSQQDCRCIVLRGLGKNFSAGLDLNEAASYMLSNGEDPVRDSYRRLQLIRQMQLAISSVANSPVPVIACVQGAFKMFLVQNYLLHHLTTAVPRAGARQCEKYGVTKKTRGSRVFGRGVGPKRRRRHPCWFTGAHIHHSIFKICIDIKLGLLRDRRSSFRSCNSGSFGSGRIDQCCLGKICPMHFIHYVIDYHLKNPK
jgi:hypothetical protein